ncbi:MAG: hypothetical protein HKN12_03395, partial [Gemmatimonadetes bacterium]|nr:hypothetical protein [Gemmatimonadota bacterium]
NRTASATPPASTGPIDRPLPSGPIVPLAWSDFQYVGAIACPRNRDYAFLDYTGIAYVESRNTLIVNSRKGLVEMTIPEPVYSPDDNPRDLNEAQVYTQQPVSPGQVFKSALKFKDRRMGGFAWHEDRIWIGMFEFYNVAGRDNPGIVSLSDTLDDPQGAWRVGPAGVNQPTKQMFHANKTHGYVCRVPPTWAATYAPGKLLASGRHRGAGAFGGAQGPALFVWEPRADAPPGSGLRGTPLLTYPTNSRSWMHGAYRNRDLITATWVWSDKGQAVVIGCTKGLGKNFYGPGPGDCYPDKGWHAHPYEPRIYLMDPYQLGEVAEGRLKPWDPQPYESVVPAFPWRTPAKGEDPNCRHPWFSAMTYDPRGRRLFVLQARAWADGRTNGSVIHVLQISDA